MRPVRVAGLLYLLVAVTGAIGLLVPLTLIVPGDAAATTDRIRASETLFRLAIASELIAAVSFIFLALALHRVFKEVDQGQAAQMVILALVSVPISFIAVASEIGALGLLSGADYLSVFVRPQLDALAYVFVRLHTQAVVVAEIFWGLWLFPLAALVLRSGFAPRALGVLLIVNGGAYVVASFTALLLPAYGSLVSIIAIVPEAIGEPAMIIWLLTTRAGAPALARGEVATAS